MKPVTVIGIGDDGCRSLSPAAFNAVQEATLLMGGARNLEFFADFPGEKVTLAGGLMATLKLYQERLGTDRIVIVASGDPLFYGIGSLVVKTFGADNVTVLPHPSSMQLAFCRLGISWADTAIISLHGRPLFGLVSRIRHTKKVALFTDADNSPAAIARHLLRYNQPHWQATVLENLGSAEERLRRFTLADLAELDDISPLNILYLEQEAATDGVLMRNMAEERFAKKIPKLGLITKKEVRVLTLASLNLPKNGVFYDVGAGSGSVAIEASHLMPEGKVYAVESDSACQEFIEDNFLSHSIDNGILVKGLAPDALSDIADDADSIFIGGSRGRMAEIVTTCHQRLKPGGTIAINAVTMESVASAHAALKELIAAEGGSYEVTLVQISRGQSLAGKYQRFQALNPIHNFSYRKPAL